MTFDPSKLSDDAVSELLLEFVHGRLDPLQTEAIEAAVASDPKLADEVAYYRGLQAAVGPTRKPAGQDELGWARLSRAIAAEERAPSGGPAPANDNQPFWKYAAAALAVVAALQTAFLVQGNSSQDEPTYITASGENEDAFALDLMFSPDATAGEITNILKAVEAEIFKGPSALGVYAVRFDTETARDAALQNLEEQPHLVSSVSIR